MFDSTSVRTSQHTTNNSYANIKFNAVSGTLFKSHPKSFIVRLPLNSPMLNTATPTYRFDFTKEFRDNGEIPYSYNYRHWEKFTEDEEPVVILQTMLCGDGYVMCEILRMNDYMDVIDG